MFLATRFLHTLPRVSVAKEEVHDSDDYFWDNTNRQSGVWVIQQTLEGSAFYEETGNRTLVGPDQCMLFAMGEPSCYGIGAERPYRLRWLSICGTTEAWLTSLRSEFGPVLRMKEKGEASRILGGLVNDLENGVGRDNLYLTEKTVQLVLALYREQVGSRQSDDPVAYGRHLIETQYRSTRNLKEWTREMGISREHFTREFRKRYQEAPACFLRRLRLEQAQHLLKTSHLSLADIAASSGFASEQTFHRAYRQHFGEPPGCARAH